MSGAVRLPLTVGVEGGRGLLLVGATDGSPNKQTENVKHLE